jgi:hypothetical protein
VEISLLVIVNMIELQDLAMSALGGAKGKGKGRAMDLDDEDAVILPYVTPGPYKGR